MNATMPSLQDDMRERMRPSEEAIAAAREFLDGNPGVRDVCTPIWFPGKEYGMWDHDTQVADCAEVCSDRDAASLIAARSMGEQPGTVGWVYHMRSGNWAVFEDILSPIDTLRYTSSES